MTARELIIAVFPSISECFGHSIKIYFREGHEKNNLYMERTYNTLGLQSVRLTVSISLAIGYNCPSHLLQYFLVSALIFSSSDWNVLNINVCKIHFTFSSLSLTLNFISLYI